MKNIICVCIVILVHAFCAASLDKEKLIFWKDKLKPEAKQKFGLLGDTLGIPPVPGLELEQIPEPAALINDSPFIVKSQTVTTCQCVASNLCTDGGGAIDPRIVNKPTTSTPIIAPPTCPSGQVYCCFASTPAPTPICGVPTPTPVPGYTPVAGQADFGEYPWMVVILGAGDTYLGGGTLIDGLNVITAAHKVYNMKPVKVRLGEWNLNSNTEPYPYVEVLIQDVVTNPGFNSVNLQNDIAVIRLASAVNLNAYPHIKAACLPAAGTNFATQRCWVAGFGTDAFGEGTIQSVMKEVDVPVIDGNTCQTRLRQTRLGSGFILNQSSFICGGGERGKDACTGDGGSPIVCKTTAGPWVVAGLVAWGLGCAAENIPGVYVNVVSYLDWINANLKK